MQGQKSLVTKLDVSHLTLGNYVREKKAELLHVITDLFVITTDVCYLAKFQA